ncbi:Calx-beta domain-containing protein, partial [[Muricauda] lutisoli]
MSTFFKNPSNPLRSIAARRNIFFVLFFLLGIGVGFGQINVQFSQATGSDAEANGGNLPELIVSGGVLGADTSVTVTDAGTGTATSGTDYAFTSPQVVVIPAADYTSPSNLPITGLSITDDSEVEPDEDIVFSLSTSDGTLTLGPQTTTTYTINNDDSVTVEFSQATGSAAENVGNNLPTLFVTG